MFHLREMSSKAEEEGKHQVIISTRPNVDGNEENCFTPIQVESNESPTVLEAIPVTNLNAGVIAWENEDDPEMPMNFTKTQKLRTIALVGSFAFVTPFASSVSASAQTQILHDLYVKGGEGDNGAGRLTVTITVAIYILGFSIGPLLLSPLSELHGRRPLILISDMIFTFWSLGCALAPSIPALVAFRFFEGVGGSGCLTITAGVLGDMFAPHERGRAMAWFQLGPNIAPFIAPIAGGYMTQTIGWRWDFWLVTILGGVVTAASIFWLKESNSRVLIRRKTQRMSKQLSRDDLKSCYAETDGASLSQRSFLIQSLIRPLKMLFLFPVILLLSIAGAILYGLQYLLLVTLSPVFETTYGFSAGITGLVYLSVGAGGFLVLAIFHFASDKSILRQTAANGGNFVPEMRVPLAIWGFVILPATFFVYGWCAQYKTHWIIPILALIPFSCGFNLLSMPLSTYVVDCYTVYAAPAMAANMALKSICGAFLPLAGPALYEKLGLGWGNTILGFIALAMTPIPVLIWKFGASLRRNDAKNKL
ncbi:putative transporter C1529.01-like protein 2 [Colletotrichum chlorophyti]|uniref:Putative transporter C1529.01-like protein 2 n=1 Tax=Colletotrichum chlorophyti TaxID=708187 RepID=A0A1Q8S0B2_9PEZI|nr:putative transporter C1529.01-like protein 2 [Colletotrichum chlorophyti]